MCRLSAVMWDPTNKKPLHLGYWPTTLAAARIYDKYVCMGLSRLLLPSLLT